MRPPVRIPRRLPQRQRGLSLIELMISMVLGLLVVSAVTNMYAGSTRSSQFTQGLQTIQENGRHGVSVLQRAWRLAGYSPDSRLDAVDIAASGQSTLVVQMRQPYDCQGHSTTAVDGIAVNTYHFDGQQITCQGNASTDAPMPIIEGVNGFRILYGIDADGDDVPERYASYDSGLNGNEIAALRFALLVNSMDEIRSKKRAETHVLLDEEITTDDRFAHHVFSATVPLRNRPL